jgi:hypothetical protein
MNIHINKSTMISILVCISSILTISNIYAQTDVPSGNVSGTWAFSGSPFRVNGDITVPNGQTLTIEPGVNVIFTGHYKFNVQGRLLAVGTRQDTITFIAQDTAIGWHGIRFVNTPATNDTSKIIYCKLQYGKATTGNYYDQSGGALYVQSFKKLLISNCLINFNMNGGNPDYTGGGAICFWAASPVLTNSTISNNNGTTGGGIICWTNANPIISNNIFANNNAWDGGGVYIGNSSNPLLINNIIVNNRASDNCGGVRCFQNSKPQIINNVIAYNHASYGGGIDCRDNADPIVINTIIYWNSAGTGNQVLIETIDSDPSFLYCDIEGGRNEFMGNGAGNNYTGSYVNNVESNPLFVDSAQNDFHLTNNSPCIGAGVDSIQVSGERYYAPAYDFEGNAKPNPDGTHPDIGAFENALGSPLTGINETKKQIPDGFQLFQNYPNPFNPSTTINFTLTQESNVKLSIYNLLGQKVASLIDGNMIAGQYSVEFDASKFSSGVYFYRLETGSFISLKKMLLLK